MYAKTQSTPETVKVQSDNGTLRLQFSTKYNPIFGGKRKHQGLSLKDTPENWQKAIAIAWRIEGDLQHPDWQQLFDPSFAKYGLKSKYTAELKLAAPIPEPEPEMTVGAMWEDYLEWKQPQLQPTTFELLYQITYTNPLKGKVYDRKNHVYLTSDNPLWDERLSGKMGDYLSRFTCCAATKHSVISALSEAFLRLQSQGRTNLTSNPFAGFNSTAVVNKTDKYKAAINADGSLLRWWDTEDTETDPDERDRRAFTKEERDIIIKAFYESDKSNVRQAAPLVEFLFLTGCRSGEAFALEWKDVFLGRDKDYIRFSKSYNGRLKNTQVTKTGETRIFKVYSKLENLLLKIKPVDAKPTDLIFTQRNGKAWYIGQLAKLWNTYELNHPQKKYVYPGVVTQLVEEGRISGYLSPYHTRHTFISLQAHAGTDLFLLATACGNSVEVIQKHYLGINPDATFCEF
ncbi:tyrosine-type recombinase/integrase [Microcoleus sp. OTE_8_concoct_300]|uniref:tyrosine-type recombinase/integrase n=1 Tax=Microcoleus sp. OTE_8_concoct_300 TaxID=2964710 RepID=UPI00403F10FC